MPRFVPPRRASASSGALAALLVGALGCLLGGGLPGSAPAAAVALQHAGPAHAESTDDETAQQEDDPPEEDLLPELVVAPVTPVFATGADEFSFELLVRNPTDEPLPGGEVSLELESQPIGSADDLGVDFVVEDDAEDSDGGDEDREPITTVDVGGTEEQSEQVVAVDVPRADFPLRAASDAGVYRFRATFAPAEEQTGEGEATPLLVTPGVSSLVWRAPSATGRVDVSTIVPIVLPREVASMPTRSQLNDLSPRLLELLDVAERHGATLAIDPRVIAGIRAYGEEVPDTAAQLLERLETTDLAAFTLQFADADPAAQAALGLDELLQPRELDFVARAGSFPAPDEAQQGEDGAQDGSEQQPDSEEGNVDHADENAEGDPEDGTGDDGGDDAEEETLPTLEELLEWPETVPTAWPAKGEVDGSTLDLLSRSDITRVIVDSGNVAHSGGPIASLGDTQAVITDAEMDDAVAEGIGAGTLPERAAGLATATSRLALSTGSDTAGLVVGLDRGATAEAEEAAEVLDGINSLGWVNAVPLDRQTTGEASLKAGSTLEDRRELLRAALGREPDIAELGPLLRNPEYLTGYQRARLLQLFATRYADPDDEFELVAEQFRARDAELLEGVHVISTEHTQLLGVSSRIPLQVHNSLPFEAEIAGEVSAASAAIAVTERDIVATVVPPEGNQTVLVPVSARVSSGESGLFVELTDVGAEQTFYSGVLPLSISSSVEKIALTALVSVAGLLLGFGIWRSVRRRSHRNSAGPDDPQGISAA